MDEGAKLFIYDPKVLKEQIIHDLSQPSISEDNPERGVCLARFKCSSGKPAKPVYTWDTVESLQEMRGEKKGVDMQQRLDSKVVIELFWWLIF